MSAWLWTWCCFVILTCTLVAPKTNAKGKRNPSKFYGFICSQNFYSKWHSDLRPSSHTAGVTLNTNTARELTARGKKEYENENHCFWVKVISPPKQFTKETVCLQEIMIIFWHSGGSFPPLMCLELVHLSACYKNGTIIKTLCKLQWEMW